MRDNILRWRPRAAQNSPASPEYPLWSMRKQQSRIDCRIHDCAEKGWKIVFLVNTEWSVFCRFASWADAITAADDKHAELEQTGWTPMAAVEGAFYDRDRIPSAAAARSLSSTSGSIEASSGKRLTSTVVQPAAFPAPMSRQRSPTMKLRSS